MAYWEKYYRPTKRRKKAKYATGFLKDLLKQTTKDFGKGFTVTELQQELNGEYEVLE